ncbi:MAG: putative deoxyribonuclease YjjV [Promethearchaeota archaeon]|nr:MAG: putative deoxyribonuclease YjjV [Candidatus Lokiarchaeota archaeon]
MLIDVHCHLNLYLNIEEVLQEAQRNGIEKIIAVSMSQISLQRVMEISEHYDMIYPALGIHPEEIKMNEKLEQNLENILTYIRAKKDDICAIGEIGLDHHFIKDNSLYPLQTKVFEAMLSLAHELQLPVNLHTKGAEKEVFDLLPSFDIPHVNIHWYSGPAVYLDQGIERGYFFSITPAIQYSPAVKKVVERVDKDLLLLESDGPVKYSGRVGVPAMIKEVLDVVSQLKNIDKEELQAQIEKNTRTIFPNVFFD